MVKIKGRKMVKISVRNDEVQDGNIVKIIVKNYSSERGEDQGLEYGKDQEIVLKITDEKIVKNNSWEHGGSKGKNRIKIWNGT
ncbi:hypothetical protein SNE40_000367 [Patella caerulea]